MPKPEYRLPSASNGPPGYYAAIAQIAQRYYAFWVRTGSRFALKFAASYANLVRTRAAACYQKLWFPLWFPAFCIGFHW